MKSLSLLVSLPLLCGIISAAEYDTDASIQITRNNQDLEISARGLRSVSQCIEVSH